MGLVIKKTEVAYPKSLPCVVVKVTCGFGRFQIQKMKVILFRRVPASSRRQDIDDFLQFALLVDQILVLVESRWSLGSA